MRSEYDNLVQRVARLEQQNRQLRIVVTAIALGAATFLLAGAAKTPKTVEAEKIVVLDRHGRARITVGTPALAGAAVDTNPDDPMIWLTDGKGTDRAVLAIDGLSFASGQARPIVRLGRDPSGLAALTFFGSNGRASWSAP